MISIFLIDDSPVYTNAFSHFLANQQDMQLAGAAGFDDDVIAFVGRVRPDIIFLAIPYHQNKAFLIAAALLNNFPWIKIICSGFFVTQSVVTRLLQAGCSSYIDKVTEPEDMEEIIRAVYNVPVFAIQ